MSETRTIVLSVIAVHPGRLRALRPDTVNALAQSIFDPRFEIMPGTKARGPEVAHVDPYEAVPRQTIAE
jgi:hypothetical protein